MEAVTIPVFAKVRIGHFVEAQILEAVGVDMIDESEGAYSLILLLITLNIIKRIQTFLEAKIYFK